MGHDLPEFDALRALYRNDPQAFEDFRRHVLREAIEQAPPQHRPALNALLEKIERWRQTAVPPMVSDSVDRLFDAWVDARYAAARLQTVLLIKRLRSGQRI